MAFLHRKLTADSDSPSNIPNTTPMLCNKICVEEKKKGYCPPSCLSWCPNLCNPTTPISNQPSSHKKASIFLIVSLSLLATTFFLVCLYVFYRKYWLSSRIRRPISDSQVDDENNDHSNDQVLIHPIWYINTVGLQSSVINSITVCKYKKGEGLINDLDCAVCLSEFEEGESLRLLPRCSHAFHLPCIDTWLRSHTNCPLCRAPIVVMNVVSSISTPQEETQLSILENDGESDTQRGGDEVHELRIRIENEEQEQEHEQVESMNEQVNRMSNEEAIRRKEPRRRSVSLDSFSASKIVNESHSRFVSDGNSNTQLQVVNKSKSVNGAKGMGLGLQKFQRQKGSSSSKGTSSRKSGAISMKRSFSNCGIHRQVQSRDSNRSLRSF